MVNGLMRLPTNSYLIDIFIWAHIETFYKGSKQFYKGTERLVFLETIKTRIVDSKVL